MEDKKIYPKTNSTIVRLLPRKFILLALSLLSKISPKLSADLGFKIFTYPIFRKRKPHLFPKGTRQHPLVINGKKSIIHHFGNSPRKILCVHGWEAAASDFSQFFEPLKQNGYEVVAIDLPGHGMSPKSSLNAAQAAEIIYQAEQLYGPFQGIIGHSFGGFSTALAISRYPQLASIPFISIGAPNKLKDIIHSFSTILGFSKLQENYLVSKLERKFAIKASDFQFAKFIQDHECATLIVHDENDKQVPIKTVDEIRTYNSHPQFIVTQGLGHNRILRSDSVIFQIMEFLNSNKDRRIEFEQAFKYGLL